MTEMEQRNIFGQIASFFLELLKVALLAGVTIVLVRYFLFKPFYVKGKSMQPNFYEHDYLIIDELTYRFREPDRGEVVVFRPPNDEKDFYLKRVIGLPNERVVVEDGKVVVYNDEHPQGILIEEVYLEEETTGAVSVTLGPDQYFVLGDNRDASLDSRRFGAIDVDAIVGRVWLRGLPLHRIGFFEHPEYNL